MMAGSHPLRSSIEIGRRGCAPWLLISLAASLLQKVGLIRCARGHNSYDRKGLEGASCECYEALNAEYERLLAPGSYQVGAE